MTRSDEISRFLGISKEAADLYLSSDVIDLHLDSFIWNRIFGYDLGMRHESGPLGKKFFYHADFPRIREAAITGGMWSITTFPFRTARGRAQAFRKNLSDFRNIFEANGKDFALVRNVSEYRKARANGKHAAFMAVQGGNALEDDFGILDEEIAKFVSRVTLMHLTDSKLGGTSVPSIVGREKGGLTELGKKFVRKLNDNRVFVDLAHISRKGFYDAVKVHAPSLPLIVTHTGVSGVYDHWRNLTDDQIRVVAASGGVIGIMFQNSFIGATEDTQTIKDLMNHIEYIIDLVGEDHPAIGSDFDGAITPLEGLETCLQMPRLVEEMLSRKWSAQRIKKILGGNFLRSLEKLKGE